METGEGIQGLSIVWGPEALWGLDATVLGTLVVEGVACGCVAAEASIALLLPRTDAALSAGAVSISYQSQSPRDRLQVADVMLTERPKTRWHADTLNPTMLRLLQGPFCSLISSFGGAIVLVALGRRSAGAGPY